MAESVGSNSPTAYDPTQHITDRIIRALSHRLALLHRSDQQFYVLGSTANVFFLFNILYTTISLSKHLMKPRYRPCMRGARAGEVCPICLDELKGGEEGSKNNRATCSKCGNSVHGECLGRWKRSRGRRGVSCVVCRARWRERREVEERYINLVAYVDDREEAERGWGVCER